jgi:transposase-like protein
MEKSKMANRYSPEVRARAVRMVLEHQSSYETQAACDSGDCTEDRLYSADACGLA